jgi:hypothetical protein
MSYCEDDLVLFEPLLDPEQREGSCYFALQPRELPRKHACWLPGSFLLRDSAFDFFAECFHRADKDFDYFAMQRLGESEGGALCNELETFVADVEATATREVVFSRYSSMFGKSIWSDVDSTLLAPAVATSGRRLREFIAQNTKESRCLWVLGM